MVADGDESALGQMVELLFVVDAEFNLEIVDEHTADEFRAGSVAAACMHGVYLVDLQEV